MQDADLPFEARQDDVLLVTLPEAATGEIELKLFWTGPIKNSGTCFWKG